MHTDFVGNCLRLDFLYPIIASLILRTFQPVTVIISTKTQPVRVYPWRAFFIFMINIRFHSHDRFVAEMKLPSVPRIGESFRPTEAYDPSGTLLWIYQIIYELDQEVVNVWGSHDGKPDNGPQIPQMNLWNGGYEPFDSPQQ